MERSTEINELAIALSKAQVEMKNPSFDSENPHFKSKFASLAAVRDASIPILAKHGIAVMQSLRSIVGASECTTIFIHSSGQFWIFDPLSMPNMKSDAQGYGSSGTYAKRYALQAACCIVGDTDDDGNAASAKKSDEVTGDLSSVNPTEAKELATDMLAVMSADVNEQTMALNALDLHNKVRHIHDLYMAASDLLKSAEKSAWKKLVEAGKKLEKADRAVDAAGRQY